MSKPQITEQPTGFLFEWPEGIFIKVSRIDIKKDGRVIGEILIQTNAEGYSPILYPQSQLNFSASRTRTEIANNLTTKYPNWEWHQIIDQLCFNVQEMSRFGEPVQELWTHEEVAKPEYLLEPVLFKGLPTVIFGEKGVAKSTTALAIYTCLTLPWYDNPLGWGAPDRSVRTLLLDWEAEADIIKYYASKIQKGMNLPPFPVNYRRCSLPLADDLEQILKHKTDIGAEVIIIDSLGQAAGGELKSPEIALKFFTALRRLKTTSLIIGQTSKDEEGRRKRIFGSVYFEYYSRSIWELCKSEQISDDELDVALFHRSCNLTSLQRPMAFHLHHNDTGLTIERTPLDIAEFRTRVSASSQVYEALKSGALSVDEIADKIDIAKDTIRVALTRLKKKERVVSLERGRWGLAHNE